MPDWQPNWTDVVFDHAAADAAAESCDAAARALDTIIDSMISAAPAARADWTGRSRTSFDAEESDLRAEASTTLADLRSLAATIRAGAEAAADEQASRVADRQRWRDERDAELAAERVGGPV